MLKRVLAAVAVLVAMAGCTAEPGASSSDPRTGEPSTASASAPPRQLLVGECTGPLNSAVSGTTPIDPVDCADEHAWEVFSVVPLTADRLPTASTLRAIANNRCLPAFKEFVGVEPAYSRYSSVFLAPDEVGWAEPSLRRITCLLGAADGGLTGSARDDSRLFPEVGECTGPQDVPILDLEVVSCKKEHHYEVYAEKVIKSGKAPSAAELTKLINEVCVTGFRKFVGVAAASSKYEYAYFIADSSLWRKVTDHRLVCSVGSPKGGIKGSLKDAKA